MMEYKTTIAFDGDWRRAVESARSVLANNNFRIDSLNYSEIVASGPGFAAVFEGGDVRTMSRKGDRQLFEESKCRG